MRKRIPSNETRELISSANSAGEKETYFGLNSITARNFIIEDGGEAIFRVGLGGEINMEDGFDAKLGCKFETEISTASFAYWDGGGADNNWTTAANWGGDTVPSATDIVYFGSNSDKNCNLDSNITVAGLIIQPGYDGTISFNDKTITITGDFIKKDGTLNAGTSKVILAGEGSGNQTVEFNSSESLYNIEITNTTGGTVVFNSGFTANEFKINPGNYLKFMAGETFVITTLTGSGTDADSVYLLSTSPYDVWNLNLTNSATLSYLIVARCNASGGAYLAAGNSVDLGGNSNCILHKVEITSVENRYHAKGSPTPATIHYEITGTPGFFADTVKLTIKDKGGVEVYPKTESGNKPIGCYTITWPANDMNTNPKATPNQSPFIATVEILKECKGISHDTAEENEKIYIYKVYLKEISFNYVGASPDAIDMKRHDTGNIIAPEWQDTTSPPDGNPEKNEPGGFKKNQQFNVKTKFVVQPDTITSIKIWAEEAAGGFGGLNSSDSPVTVNFSNGEGEGTFQINTTPTKIMYKNITWTWKGKDVNGSGSGEFTIGPSSHEICIIAADPVSEPVFKWVAFASCKSADGQTSDTTKTIVDDIFNTLADSARVDNWTTKLEYDLNAGYGDGETEFLLDNKKSACANWASYFRDLCRVQGIDLTRTGFQIVKKTWITIPKTNYDGEEKWEGFLVTKAGINSSGPGAFSTKLVNPGKYAMYEGARTDINEVYDAPETFKRWGVTNHAVCILTAESNYYLYDSAYEVGPKHMADWNSMPSGEKEYSETDDFREIYFDDTGNISHVHGKIRIAAVIDRIWLSGVPQADVDNDNASPSKLYFLWGWPW